MSGLLHRLARDLRTARHVPTPQLFHRARFLVLRRLYRAFPEWPIRAARRRAAGALARRDLPRLPLLAFHVGESGDPRDGWDARVARARDAAEGRFTHLGTSRDYAGRVDWDDDGVSPLWAYQMQYLGALVDMACAGDAPAAMRHLESWRARFEERWDAVAWHPYPVSLRIVNVCAAAAILGGFDALGDGVERFVAVHARYLERHVEQDVRGNHLLENVVALLFAARFVDGSVDGGGRRALALLRHELREQVLSDGMHFELSPMYHLIVMQRLFLLLYVLGDDGEDRQLVHRALGRMGQRLAWLRSPDGEIPVTGDAARGFSVPAEVGLAMVDLVHPGAGLDPDTIPGAPEGVSSAPDAGLHVLRQGELWCLLDAGPVCPEYLPAHGQADALTVEVWVGEHCLVTDSGLHEYTGPERAWGRSSRAHSTITVDDRDSSEVYGSFRVGGREVMERVAVDDASVTATLRPWGIDARLTRRASLPGRGVLRLDDSATAPSGSVVRSRLHLHPDVEVVSGEGTNALVVRVDGRDVTIAASGTLTLEPGRCSRRFGEIRETRIAVLELPRDEDGTARGRLEIRPGGRG